MTPVLSTLIASGESTTLEWKRSTGELREALQSVCAFANGAGGRVLIGIRPDGTITGCCSAPQAGGGPSFSWYSSFTTWTTSASSLRPRSR